MITLLRGSLALFGYLVNTFFWGPCIFFLGLIKLVPIAALRKVCTYLIDTIATTWVSINNANQRIFSRTQLIVNDLPKLSSKQWYMVIANHQSWVDILLLQRIFNRKIPMLKFFLKIELIFVPVIGLAWWALDFPFMRRYSKAKLEKYPQLKGKDQEATRKSCEKFQIKPVAVMNFVEGTRFTPQKHQRQQSNYPHLLTPKAGGLAMSLDAMGGKIQQLLNVTIYYPNGIPTFWQFLSGQVPKVEIRIEHCDLDEVSRLDYHQPEQRQQIQAWLNDLWQKKSDNISAIHHRYHQK